MSAALDQHASDIIEQNRTFGKGGLWRFANPEWPVEVCKSFLTACNKLRDLGDYDPVSAITAHGALASATADLARLEGRIPIEFVEVLNAVAGYLEDLGWDCDGSWRPRTVDCQDCGKNFQQGPQKVVRCKECREGRRSVRSRRRSKKANGAAA